MAADKVHLLLISDVDLIFQDFRLFVGIISKEGFQVSDFCGVDFHSLNSLHACFPRVHAFAHLDIGLSILGCRIL